MPTGGRGEDQRGRAATTPGLLEAAGFSGHEDGRAAAPASETTFAPLARATVTTGRGAGSLIVRLVVAPLAFVALALVSGERTPTVRFIVAKFTLTGGADGPGDGSLTMYKAVSHGAIVRPTDIAR